MFSGAVKFIELSKHSGQGKVLVNLNNIVFVDDLITYREVTVKLPDKVITLNVDDEINTIHGMIELYKTNQPIFD